jgi:hypothetical protein
MCRRPWLLVFESNEKCWTNVYWLLTAVANFGEGIVLHICFARVDIVLGKGKAAPKPTIDQSNKPTVNEHVAMRLSLTTTIGSHNPEISVCRMPNKPWLLPARNIYSPVLCMCCDQHLERTVQRKAVYIICCSTQHFCCIRDRLTL